MVYPLLPLIPTWAASVAEAPRSLTMGGDRGGVIERSGDGFVNPVRGETSFSVITRDYSTFQAAVGANRVFRVNGFGDRAFLLVQWSARLVGADYWEVAGQLREVFRP